MIKLYAVIGKPILHSKSPPLMNAAFTLRDMDAHYTRLASSDIADAMYLVQAIGLEGINCTAPYKADLVKYADLKSEEVIELGVANTLVSNEEDWKAFNTDITGVWNSLEEKISKFENPSILIIGAGGAASSAAMALHLHELSFTISNRTLQKAAKIATQFSGELLEFEHLYEQLDNYHIIISTIDSQVLNSSKITLNKEHILFDAIYKNSIWKEKLQHPSSELVTGKEWLIHQGIEAFLHFTNQKAFYSDWEKAFHQNHLSKQKIALIGFMGSGKSAVGKHLSEISNWTHIDADDWIEKSEKTTIKSIFENEGEERFRDIETEALKELINSDYKIISTGGGIIKKAENRNLLMNNCICIWLYIDATTCLTRVSGDQRPLLNHAEPSTVVNKLLTERKDHYAICSDLIVNTINKSIEDIAKLIHEEINQAGIS